MLTLVSYADYQSFQANVCNRSFGWPQAEMRTQSSSRLLSLIPFAACPCMCRMIMILVDYGKFRDRGVGGFHEWVVS